MIYAAVIVICHIIANARARPSLLACVVHSFVFVTITVIIIIMSLV